MLQAGAATVALCLLSSQVFDVQRKVTYKNLSNWYKELREFRPQIPCIVVANKIDGRCPPPMARWESGFALFQPSHVLEQDQTSRGRSCVLF